MDFLEIQLIRKINKKKRSVVLQADKYPLCDKYYKRDCVFNESLELDKHDFFLWLDFSCSQLANNVIVGEHFVHRVNRNHIDLDLSGTVGNVSKYGVFSCPYFPAFELNTERYFVSLRIQSECGKIRTRKNSVFGHFSRSVSETGIAVPWSIKLSKYFNFAINGTF